MSSKQDLGLAAWATTVAVACLSVANALFPALNLESSVARCHLLGVDTSLKVMLWKRVYSYAKTSANEYVFTAGFSP